MKKYNFVFILLAINCLATVQSQNLTNTLTSPVPRSLDVTCLSSDALHPVPGNAYTYTISVPTPPGEKSFRWMVTQEQTFLTDGILNLANAEEAGGLHLATAGAELNNVTSAGTGEDIEITWKSFVHDPLMPVFVIIYVENADGCTAQNMKVFQIEPRQAFTLDIANLAADGTPSAYGEAMESCLSNIASARFDPLDNNHIVYDYGTDYLFFVVNAAGVSGAWQPDFRLSGIIGSQETSIEWSYPVSPDSWNAATDPVQVRAVSGTTDSSGECIIVRLTVKHHAEEVLTGQSIVLAVDGTSNSLPDINHTDCAADGFDNDFATHILKPRPAILKL